MLDRAVVAGGPRTTRGYFPSLRLTFSDGAFDPDGHRMGDFLSGTTAAATEFSESWELLRDIVQGSGVSGPLDSEVASAGRGVGQHYR